MKYQGKDKIIKVDKAEVYSTEYRKGLFVAIDSGVQENSEITFDCIKELIILKDDSCGYGVKNGSILVIMNH